MTKLEKGMPAPDFELLDAEGNKWWLSALRGQKVILYFYPADDTPGCTKEACDFRDSKDDFESAGFVVLGVSPQEAESHAAFARSHRLKFPLLVDEDLSVAERYGTTAQEERSYKDIAIKTRRSTFVIDEDGNLIEALYDVNAREHVGDLVRQFARTG
ncbi:MAG: peroxiredoxin [Actinomycetota bacterium]